MNEKTCNKALDIAAGLLLLAMIAAYLMTDTTAIDNALAGWMGR